MGIVWTALSFAAHSTDADPAYEVGALVIAAVYFCTDRILQAPQENDNV